MKILLILFILFTTLSLTAMEEKDSLKRVLTSKKITDTSRCKLLNRLVNLEDDIQIWPAYNQELMTIAQKHLNSQNTKELRVFSLIYAEGLNNLGYYYNYIGNTQLYLKYSLQSLAIQKKYKNELGVADVEINLGYYYVHQGDIQKGLEYYNDALQRYSKLNNAEGLAYCYNNIGSVYSKQEMYEKAFSSYNKAIYYYRQMKDELFIALIQMNVGDLYTMPKFRLCPQNDKDCEEKRFLKAKTLYENSYVSLKKLGLEANLADVCLALAVLHFEAKAVLKNTQGVIDEKNNLMNCKNYLEESLKYRKTSENFEGLIRTEIGLANYYFEVKDYKNGLFYGEKALKSSEKENIKEMMLDAMLVLSSIHKAKGDFPKAFEYLQKSTQLKEEIYKEDVKKATLEKSFQIEYERKAAKDQARMEQIKKIQSLKMASQAESTRKVWISLIASLIIVLGLAYGLWYIARVNNERKKAYLTLQERNLQIEQQGKKLAFQSAEISKYQSQMNPHFIFNGLNSIQGLIMNNDKEKTITQLQRLSKLMRQTLNNSEHELISLTTELEYLQLYFNFEQLRFSKEIIFNVNCNLAPEEIELPPMLIQPLIENALKHAGLDNVDKPKIELTLNVEKELLTIFVKDNGLGSNKKTADILSISHAMSIIKSRLILLFEKEKLVFKENYFEFRSQPEVEQGVEIHIKIPFMSRF